MKFIDDKRLLFFSIAFITTYSAATMPSTPWEWSKLVAGCLGSGLVALKSYQSSPQNTPEAPNPARPVQPPPHNLVIT